MYSNKGCCRKAHLANSIKQSPLVAGHSVAGQPVAGHSVAEQPAAGHSVAGQPCRLQIRTSLSLCEIPLGESRKASGEDSQAGCLGYGG
jgi:hypothetical protein